MKYPRKLVKQLMAVAPSISARGAERWWCGERLGYGAGRQTYILKQDPNYVVKIAHRDDNFENVKEWLIWNEVQYSAALSKWFAPAILMNSNGSVLVMRRAEPVKKKDCPKIIPAFFIDLKIENFGTIDGQFVCVDYGSSFCITRTVPIIKEEITATRSAKWWSVEAKIKKHRGKIPNNILNKLQ